MLHGERACGVGGSYLMLYVTHEVLDSHLEQSQWCSDSELGPCWGHVPITPVTVDPLHDAIDCVGVALAHHACRVAQVESETLRAVRECWLASQVWS